MTRSLLVLAALAVGLPVTAAEPGWQAGFAAVKITPADPMWMSGYAARTAPAEGTETDLWAKAMVLRAADGRTAVLVTLDLVGIDRELSQRICKAIQDQHRLPREAIVVSTSHTHCGPVVGTNLRSMYFFDDAEWNKVVAYTEKLPGNVLAAVDAAVAKLEPVTLSWAVGTAGFAVNRRENKEPDVPKLRADGKLKGPSDHDVPVLAARDASGKLKGIVFGYACHATVLSFNKWCGRSSWPETTASNWPTPCPRCWPSR
jgi:neutral ceramidase